MWDPLSGLYPCGAAIGRPAGRGRRGSPGAGATREGEYPFLATMDLTTGAAGA